MEKLKEKILKILEAIDYRGDRSDFGDRFVEIITKKVLIQLLESKQIKEVNTPEELEKILSLNFTAEQIESVTKSVTQQIFGEYLEEIDPSLNDSQRQKLITVLAELE